MFYLSSCNLLVAIIAEKISPFHIFCRIRNHYLAWTYNVFYCLLNTNSVWRYVLYVYDVSSAYSFSPLTGEKTLRRICVLISCISSISCMLQLLQKKFHNLLTLVFIFSCTIAIFIPGWTHEWTKFLLFTIYKLCLKLCSVCLWRVFRLFVFFLTFGGW